ncbi:unnamed protein product [Blepharisma stoltei]|uniref:C2 domain-containing protein n=1 Tax=Blepharisma stoltei TaxID=1481888 RepID=A0AAU9K2Q1_9CILI|nr:unnamed protein product [Blepharisma stoltei]
MGDCASRPKEEEVNSHIKYKDNKNDKYFIPLVDMPYLKDINNNPITTADEQDQITQYVKLLEIDIKKTEAKIKELRSDPPKNSGSRIVIEIQKGKDIIPDILCFQDAKVYVIVEIQPLKTKFQTKVSKKFIPSWFEVFKANLPLSQAQKIIFTVMLDVKLGSPIEFGKVEIDFKDLQNQDTLVGWYDIKSNQKREGNPSLLIRAQYIYDDYVFQQNNLKRCEEFVPKARNALNICRYKLEKVEEIIGPEGRGDVYENQY